MDKFKKYGVWVLAVAIFGGIVYWLFKISTKPLPGEAVADAGRTHVVDISGATYSSNPPSSGSHFPVWAKPGVYDRFISDGYFIHSMEHGYVIIWYDCGTNESTPGGQPLTKMTVQPTSSTSWITPQTEPAEEVPLPESFKSDSCKNLVSQLSEFTKVAQRVIVTPRQNMDSPIVLTAWDRIEKLGKVDKDAIVAFIKAFHNRGPEQTME